MRSPDGICGEHPQAKGVCKRAFARRAAQGLTLLELMIVLAVAVILGAMALPSFSAMLQHKRLSAAAHELAADLGEARQEAIRRGKTVQLLFGGGGARWCYVVVAGGEDAVAPDCSAHDAAAGARPLKRVSAAAHPGITLLDAPPMRLAANGAGVSLDAPAALLANARGEQLRVRLSRLGHASVCAPAPRAGDLRGC